MPPANKRGRENTSSMKNGPGMEKIKNIIFHPISMLIIGLITGVIVKLIDIYFRVQHLGFSLSDVFSQLGVWIVIGVIISLFSKNKRYAMLNVFLFCIGMLITYYITAEVTNSVYGWNFIKGWVVFACCSPLMAYLVTLTKNKGIFPLIIKIGIFVVYLVTDILLFGGPRIYDFIFILLLIYLLFIKKYQ